MGQFTLENSPWSSRILGSMAKNIHCLINYLLLILINVVTYFANNFLLEIRFLLYNIASYNLLLSLFFFFLFISVKKILGILPYCPVTQKSIRRSQIIYTNYCIAGFLQKFLDIIGNPESNLFLFMLCSTFINILFFCSYKIFNILDLSQGK